MTSDRGDVVLGWLLRLALVLAVAGGVLADGVSLGVGHFRAQQDADASARAAAQSWSGAHDVQTAFDAAWAVASSDGGTVDTSDFVVASDGSVSLRVAVPVHTLLVRRLPPLHGWTTARATGSGRAARTS